MTRELWETVVDLMEALEPQRAALAGLVVTRAALDLPVECVFVETKVGFQIRVDAPAVRIVSGLGRKPTNLRMTVERRPHEPQ